MVYSYYEIFFLLLGVCRVELYAFNVTQVTIVSITPYFNIMTVPAFQAAIDTVNRQYSGSLHFQHVDISRKEIYGCGELAENAVDWASTYFYSKSKQHSDLLLFISACVSHVPAVLYWHLSS